MKWTSANYSHSNNIQEQDKGSAAYVKCCFLKQGSWDTKFTFSVESPICVL